MWRVATTNAWQAEDWKENRNSDTTEQNDTTPDEGIFDQTRWYSEALQKFKIFKIHERIHSTRQHETSRCYLILEPPTIKVLPLVAEERKISTSSNQRSIDFLDGVSFSEYRFVDRHGELREREQGFTGVLSSSFIIRRCFADQFRATDEYKGWYIDYMADRRARDGGGAAYYFGTSFSNFRSSHCPRFQVRARDHFRGNYTRKLQGISHCWKLIDIRHVGTTSILKRVFS